MSLDEIDDDELGQDDDGDDGGDVGSDDDELDPNDHSVDTDNFFLLSSNHDEVKTPSARVRQEDTLYSASIFLY